MALPSKKYTNWYKLCCLSLYIFSCFKGTREHKNQIFCTIGDSPTADVEAIYQRTRPYHRFKAAKTSTKEQLDQFGCWLEKVIILCLLFWWVYFFYMSCLFRLLLLLLVKYFSPFPAVKIGKKKVCTIICKQMITNDCTHFSFANFYCSERWKVLWSTSSKPNLSYVAVIIGDRFAILCSFIAWCLQA